MHLYMTPLCSALLISLAAIPAHAENFLTDAQIESLVKGKTVSAKHLKKGFSFKVYFDDGSETAYRTDGDEIVETRYRIEGGRHCIHWKNKDRCARIRDNGDGSYTRVNQKGRDVVLWTGFVDGKEL